MYCLNDYKKNGAILESPKSDVLRNIIQAHFFHTLSHSSFRLSLGKDLDQSGRSVSTALFIRSH